MPGGSLNSKPTRWRPLGTLLRWLFSFLATIEAWSSPLKKPPYELGARVRITRGRLAGVTGVVTRITESNFNVVLTIDDWPNGTYVVVRGDVLELKDAPRRTRRERRSAESRGQWQSNSKAALSLH
jgi:KOW motif